MKNYFSIICLFFIMTFLGFPAGAYSQDVSFSAPCPTTGELTVNGSWAVLDGSVSLTLTPNNCTFNETTLSGEGSVSGTFKMMGATKANVALTTNFTGTISVKGDVPVDATYLQTVNGEYDMSTEKLTGELSTSWTSSGEISIKLMELLSINWADELKK